MILNKIDTANETKQTNHLFCCNLQGLFSRITFREPIFLGGTGNITGIDKKISVSDGYVGCIRKFTANEQEYIFSMAPLGNVTQIFDVRKY